MFCCLFLAKTARAARRDQPGTMPRCLSVLGALNIAAAAQLGAAPAAGRSRKASSADGDTTRQRTPTLLLDIDGTLCRTDALYQKAFQELLSPFGYDVDEAWSAGQGLEHQSRR